MGLSEKQKEIFRFGDSGYDALICDGAIRTGKSSLMTAAFIDWAMERFDRVRFGICGKTADGAAKNLILPYLATSMARRKYRLRWRPGTRELTVETREGKRRRRNTFELFGGVNESSFMLIQGRTLGGILVDEAALLPRSFVEQAVARCSLSGAKLWFNCNPASPAHWFYREWICRAEEKNALRLRFRLEDNPALSEATLKRYRAAYSGVFMRRYILGEWCAAEGLVYDPSSVRMTEEVPEAGDVYISVDYGTMNPFSAGLWRVARDPSLRGGVRAVRLREFYHDGRGSGVSMTDEDYCGRIEELAAGLKVKRVIVDPSASSFITALRRRGFTVLRAKNDVLDGIRVTAGLFRAGVIQIHPCCRDTVRELSLYRWDDGGERDAVVKENDHAMDDIRYFANTILTKRRIL